MTGDHSDHNHLTSYINCTGKRDTHKARQAVSLLTASTLWGTTEAWCHSADP